MKQLITPRRTPAFVSPIQSASPSGHVLAWARHIPWSLILITLLLGLAGVMALYSAAHGDWGSWPIQHTIRLALGVLVMVGVSFIPTAFIRRYAWLWWLGAIGLLAVIELIGTGKGAQRWISIAGFNLQPSEGAKLAVIVMLAAYFHGLYAEMTTYIRTYIPVAIIIGIPFIMVAIQPDLGTSGTLLLTAAAVVFIAGMPRWMIASITGIVLAALPLVWAMLYPYQRDRILVLLNPERDLLGAGYQIAQSKIALGSGGLLGKGYIKGSQSHLDFLPERHTDFIFTMIGEEFGLLGCLYVIGLYTALGALLFAYGKQMKSVFAKLLTAGVMVMIGLYVIINIAMVSGIIPVVGAPLPLISYGGSAMLAVFVGLGLVAGARRAEKD